VKCRVVDGELGTCATRAENRRCGRETAISGQSLPVFVRRPRRPCERADASLSHNARPITTRVPASSGRRPLLRFGETHQPSKAMSNEKRMIQRSTVRRDLSARHWPDIMALPETGHRRHRESRRAVRAKAVGKSPLHHAGRSRQKASNNKAVCPAKYSDWWRGERLFPNADCTVPGPKEAAENRSCSWRLFRASETGQSVRAAPSRVKKTHFGHPAPFGRSAQWYLTGQMPALDVRLRGKDPLWNWHSP